MDEEVASKLGVLLLRRYFERRPGNVRVEEWALHSARTFGISARSEKTRLFIGPRVKYLPRVNDDAVN